MYVLLLARIALTGIFVFTVLSVYYLIRLLRPNIISGSLRCKLWQVVLAISAVSLIWPRMIYYPLDTPDWFFKLQIFHHFTTISFSDLLAGELNNAQINFWRIFFPLGAATYLVISKRLLWDTYDRAKRLRKMKSREEIEREASDLDAGAWYKYLAIWRDRLSYYKKGEVRFEPLQQETLSFRIKNWYHSIIPVKAQMPPIAANIQEKTHGAQILDRLQHPYIITHLLHELISIVYWFVPNWWFSDKLLLADIQAAREERIRKKLIQSDRKVRSRYITKVSAIIIFVIIACFFYWQLPTVYLPNLNTAERRLPQGNYGLQVVMVESVQRPTPSTEEPGKQRFLIDETKPLVYLDNDQVFLEKINPSGTTDWKTGIDLASGVSIVSSYIPGIESISLMDSKIIENGNFVLICKTISEFNTETFWYLLLNAAGELIDLHLIDPPSETMIFKLASDGGFIAYSNNINPGGNSLQLWRYDSQQQLIWNLDAADIDKDIDWRLRDYPYSYKVIADNDGGYYLIASPQIEYNNVHKDNGNELCIMIYQFDDQGRIKFRKYINSPGRLYQVNDYVLDSDNKLYFGGRVKYIAAELIYPTETENSDSRLSYQNYSEAWTSGFIMAVDQNGKLILRKTIPMTWSSYINEMLLQDETITVLMYAYKMQNTVDVYSWQKYIWQTDLAGNLTARRNVTDNQQIFIQPAIVYIESPELEPPDLVR